MYDIGGCNVLCNCVYQHLSNIPWIDWIDILIWYIHLLYNYIPFFTLITALPILFIYKPLKIHSFYLLKRAVLLFLQEKKYFESFTWLIIILVEDLSLSINPHPPTCLKTCLAGEWESHNIILKRNSFILFIQNCGRREIIGHNKLVFSTIDFIGTLVRLTASLPMLWHYCN